MKTIATQAGDDSEGKMWGLEGSSLLIVIGGVVSGVIVTVAAFSYSSCPPVMALGYGTLPAILGIIYVFTLRERRPKSFDSDLLETLICGRSWQQKPLAKPHPLFSLFLVLIFPIGLQAQFVPGQYTNVEHNKNYEFTLLKDEPYGIQIGAQVLWLGNNTPHIVQLFLNGEPVFHWRQKSGSTESGLQMAGFGRNIEGPLKAGTKLRLRGTMEAPQSPSARIVTLYVYSLSYDAAAHLTGLERKIQALETIIANLLPRIDQNALRINELSGQILNLRSELNEFRQRFDALNLNYSQFKTDVVNRFDAIEKRIASVEDNLKVQIAILGQRFENFDRNYSQFKSKTNSEFAAINEKNTALEKRFSKFQADHNGFKTRVDSRFDAINKRHTSLENKFGTELNGLSQRLDKFQGEQEQQNSGINARFSAMERRSLRRDRLNNTLGIIGTSVGGTAVLLGGKAIVSQAVDEHKSLHEAYEQEQSTEGSSL